MGKTEKNGDKRPQKPEGRGKRHGRRALGSLLGRPAGRGYPDGVGGKAGAGGSGALCGVSIRLRKAHGARTAVPPLPGAAGLRSGGDPERQGASDPGEGRRGAALPPGVAGAFPEPQPYGGGGGPGPLGCPGGGGRGAAAGHPAPAGQEGWRGDAGGLLAAMDRGRGGSQADRPGRGGGPGRAARSGGTCGRRRAAAEARSGCLPHPPGPRLRCRGLWGRGLPSADCHHGGAGGVTARAEAVRLCGDGSCGSPRRSAMTGGDRARTDPQVRPGTPAGSAGNAGVCGAGQSPPLRVCRGSSPWKNWRRKRREADGSAARFPFLCGFILVLDKKLSK